MNALVRTGVVVVCCGSHHPTPDCSCCHECPTSLDMAGLDPAIRAVLAGDARERHIALRVAVRRAEDAVGQAGYWDLFRATTRAVAVFTLTAESPRYFPRFKGEVA